MPPLPKCVFVARILIKLIIAMTFIKSAARTLIHLEGLELEKPLDAIQMSVLLDK